MNINQEQLQALKESKSAELLQATNAIREAQDRVAFIEQSLRDIEASERLLASFSSFKPRPAQKSSESISHDKPAKIGSKRERVLSLAMKLIEKGPALTDEILEQAERDGIRFASNERASKLGNISAYLSRAKKDLGITTSRKGWVKIESLRPQKTLWGTPSKPN